MNIVVSASLNQLWSMINTQQLIVLMPLFKTSIPANAGIFFNQIMQIAAFDLIEINGPLNYLLDLKPTGPLNQNFGAIGFESIFLINNMGTLGIAFLVWLLLAIIYFITRPCRYFSEKVTEIHRNLRV